MKATKTRASNPDAGPVDDVAALVARVAALEALVVRMQKTGTLGRELAHVDMLEREAAERQQRKDAEAAEHKRTRPRREARFRAFVSERLAVHPGLTEIHAYLAREYRAWCGADVPLAEVMADDELGAAVAGLPGVKAADVPNRVNSAQAGYRGCGLVPAGTTAAAFMAALEAEQRDARARDAERDRHWQAVAERGREGDRLLRRAMNRGQTAADAHAGG
jgi:hypothetical protein